MENVIEMESASEIMMDGPFGSSTNIDTSDSSLTESRLGLLMQF